MHVGIWLIFRKNVISCSEADRSWYFVAVITQLNIYSFISFKPFFVFVHSFQTVFTITNVKRKLKFRLTGRFKLYLVNFYGISYSFF